MEQNISKARRGETRFFPPACFSLCMVMVLSCSSGAVSEETLRLYARAGGIYSAGRFEEAARMLAGAGSFPPALVLRGKAEYFSGGAAAEGLFRRALKKRPAAAEASLYLARILREQGKNDEAEALIEAVLGDDPSDIRALRFAADISREKGPAGEAAALGFLDRAAEASSEAALVFLDRARLRWIGGNGQGAMEDILKAKNLLPPDAPVFRAVENLESIIGSLTKEKEFR